MPFEIGGAEPGPVAGSGSALFPGDAARRRVETVLGKWLAASRLRRSSAPVAPEADVHHFLAELTAFDFARPEPLDDLLHWTLRRMERGIVQIAHPRYFGLFNPAPSFPAECADRIAASFNPQLATATTSPFPVAVETHMARSLAARAGFPAGASGHFTSGGSEANFTALIAALTRVCPEFARAGARAFPGTPVLYVSREAHLAWLKIAHAAGIGRDAVRLVATDGKGRMRIAALESALAADVAAGAVPVMVVATAGTTGAGEIDPIPACVTVAHRHHAWLHVDAAWGGGALVSDRLRPLLHGIEHADSATIDAHKWLATTMGCGLFLIARPALLGEAFTVAMECMPSRDVAMDPYVNSAQWSRRFLGLRLFLALGAAGWNGYARHVERAVDMAASLSARLGAHGWRQLNTAPLAVLCMAPPHGDAAHIAREVVASGAAWISAVTFENTLAVRICITSGETSETDLEALTESLVASAAARGG